MLVRGSHTLCRKSSRRNSTRSPIACPVYHSPASLRTLMDRAAHDYFNGVECRDQDVQLQVVRQTCLNDTFSDAYPPLKNIIFTPNRISCRHFAPICNCTRQTCPPRVRWDWVRILHGVCPDSCG